MNRYQNSTPRAAFGIAAAALTAMTIGLAVVLPAKLDAGRAADRPLTSVHARTPAVTGASAEAFIFPARIDVQGFRDPELASARAPGTGARRNTQG